MILSRRALFATTALLAAPRLGLAQPVPPPILFIHGNGDHAALWQTTLWRFESNGWPRDRMMAVNMPDPLARDDDTVPQPMRSGSAEQTRRLGEFVTQLRERTGAPRVALVGNSRGGNPIRDFVAHQGGAPQVSHAVLCGTPNRGVYDWPEIRNREFNSTGVFLSRLNGGATDVVPGTEFLTIRSAWNDLFAQPRAVWSPTPDRATGTDVAGPELRGATNIVLGELDHRETAYHWRAFREQFRFIAGREPDHVAVVPEPRPVLDGIVTQAAPVVTNRPVADAVVEVFRTDPKTGARIGEALHRRTTGADGRWGPVTVASDWPLEIVVVAPGHTTTHIYRNPFPRSSDVVHLRPRTLAPTERAAGGVVVLQRPRGYFGIPRDIVLLDGQQPATLRSGVAVAAAVSVALPAAELGRPVVGIFNTERIVARVWPAAEDRIAVAELTW
jgi:pimeloyl-ACP methyl ester carboxylesterase